MNIRSLEKNKKSIRVYCIVLRVAGWVLMAGGVFAAAHWLRYANNTTTDARMVRYFILPTVVVSYLYMGVFALGLAQLITYIFDREYKPGWLLRRADKVMYLYTALVLLKFFLPYFHIFHLSQWWQIPARLLLMAAYLVILIGLARLLRLVMPMIEESRTLV